MRLGRTHWLAALNLAGWAIFGVIFAALFPDPLLTGTARATEITCLGTIITLGLRWFYIASRSTAKPAQTRVIIACVASTAGALIWLGAIIPIIIVVKVAPLPPRWIIRDFVSEIVYAGLPLLGWSFLYFTTEDWLSWNDQEQRLIRASALAQTAQLQMLRYQLNPHFLFNALNSIRALIDEDASKAREMITQLSDFLSYSLQPERYPDVPLRTELQALDHYFAIQKKRYEDKLEVSFEIDPDAREVRVLSFLIHPVVENAVKYGMSTSPMPLRIRITARREGESLNIRVSNTGRWVTPAGNRVDSVGTSTGLENVKKRLENAYPGHHLFRSSSTDGWVNVELHIPVLSGASHEIASYSSGGR